MASAPPDGPAPVPRADAPGAAPDVAHASADRPQGSPGLGASAPPFALPMAEFVALIAFLMALTALSVDIMLVVLPDIAAEFALPDRNAQQFMITAYLGAFAFGHIFAGPLSDRFGRRPVLLLGVVIYVAASGVAIVAESYATLLAARALQGFGAAGPRVVAVAVVRDRFVGREMSRVMSFVMTVFIILPIVAPAIGQLIASFGSWPPIFVFLFLFGCGLGVWVFVRLPETNPRTGPDAAPPVTALDAVRTIVTTLQTMGYMLALGFVFGCLMTYITTSQQLFADIYGVVEWFPAVFASVAGGMVVATFVNARLVRTLGMRVLSHSAVLGMIAVSGMASAGVALAGTPPLWLLIACLALCFFLIGLILPNFNAMAMEPLGRIAGTGSSFVGFVMTGFGAVFGGLIGQFYDGTVRPLLFGIFIYSVVCLIIVLAAERGRLMRPQSAPAGG